MRTSAAKPTARPVENAASAVAFSRNRSERSTTSAQANALAACDMAASRIEYHIRVVPNQIAMAAAQEMLAENHRRATPYPIKSVPRPANALPAMTARLYGNRIPSRANVCSAGTMLRAKSPAMNAGYHNIDGPTVQWLPRYPV